MTHALDLRSVSDKSSRKSQVEEDSAEKADKDKCLMLWSCCDFYYAIETCLNAAITSADVKFSPLPSQQLAIASGIIRCCFIRECTYRFRFKSASMRREGGALFSLLLFASESARQKLF